MPDSVAVVESKKNRNAAETALQGWLDDNATVTSVDQVIRIYAMRDRVGYAIFYTA